MGIATDYELSRPESIALKSFAIYRFGISYFSITLSLNVFLTLMISARLFLHNRKLQNISETSVLTSRAHMTVATMLIESCALYAVTLLLYIVPWGTKGYVEYIFLPLLADAQVRAVFYIFLALSEFWASSSNRVDR
jgi:hypothetical protein